MLLIFYSLLILVEHLLVLAHRGVPVGTLK
jgi:hypothetical protein